jgi:hypothetical protein
MDTRYVTPGRSTKMFNGAVAGLTKLGLSDVLRAYLRIERAG